MHPAIRLLVFVLFSASLSLRGSLWYGLLAGGILLLLAWRWCPRDQTWRALARLRWFFLSLLLLGVWFPPLAGDHLGGLWFSLAHIGILALIVLAAQVLLATTPTPLLIAALDWLLAPFSRLGLPIARFSLRLALVLETVGTMHRLTLSSGEERRRENTWVERSRGLGQRAADLFVQAMHRGETEPLREVEIPELGPPTWWHWLYPAGLCGLPWLV
jgi:energy-coupling factor transporter transmembrane protein EcfT